jgi:hypothetical protein
MQNIFRSSPLLVALLACNGAWAHGDFKCDVPKEEWKPQLDLQKKLVSEGWRVRRVKVDNGCYEVYGFNEKGGRAEVYFNPKTFEKIGEVKQAE